MRDRAKAKRDFSLKGFHQRILAIGPIRLDLLAEEMA